MKLDPPFIPFDPTIRAREVGDALRASRDTQAIAAANERMRGKKLCPNCITRECAANWCYGQGCECDCEEATMFREQGAEAVHAKRRAAAAAFDRARKANYAIECKNRHAIIIRDLGPWDQHPTITNDAATVVSELAPQLLGRRLYYFDSEGELDELVVRDGRFAGFRIGPRVNVLEEPGR